MRRILGALGRSSLTVGVLLLLFVSYQLWGTGLYTSREQDQLRDEFTSSVSKGDEPSGSTTTTAVTAPTVTTTTSAPAPKPPAVAEGDAIARIRIPQIAVDSIVVEGISRADLRRGPGHYPDSPFLGYEGNAAIAGHRTTYGAPFGSLDKLRKGDRIFVRTAQGSYTYKVYEANLVVKPTDVQVLDTDRFRPATLTLTTCHPKFSAAERLVVKAVLLQDALPLPTDDGAKPPKLTDEGLSGEESSQLPTLIAGLVVAAIGLLWWLLFHRHPSLPNWLLGVIPFGAALFVFYALLERVLPSNY